MWLDVDPDGIPPELRVQPFVLWRATPNPDKPDKPLKVPYQIADPDRKASATNPATWGSFQDAVDAIGLVTGGEADLGPIAGVAVILSAAAKLFCIDLDRVLEGDVLDRRAARITAAFGSYTERSPSGRGLHIFGRGHVAKAIKGDQIEVYGDARMICMTGQRWSGTPYRLEPCQPLLERLREEPPPRRVWTGPVTPPPDDLGGALLAKVQAWRLPVTGGMRRWEDGFLIELRRCPWADVHTTGFGGAAVIIRASGAFDFVCQHAHCVTRTWQEFRQRMETV